MATARPRCTPKLIKTNTAKIEPSFNSGIFRPEPFLNDNNNKGYVLGLTPPARGRVLWKARDIRGRATEITFAIIEQTMKEISPQTRRDLLAQFRLR